MLSKKVLATTQPHRSDIHSQAPESQEGPPQTQPKAAKPWKVFPEPSLILSEPASIALEPITWQEN
jgi:hypothetical protein